MVHSRVYKVHSRVHSGEQQSGQWCTAEWTQVHSRSYIVHSKVYIVHSKVDSGVYSGAQKSRYWFTAVLTVVHSRVDSGEQQSVHSAHQSVQ